MPDVSTLPYGKEPGILGVWDPYFLDQRLLPRGLLS